MRATEPPVRSPSTVDTAPAFPRPDLSIGQLVGGHFQILRLLGSGGMGRVYEALDRTLNRRVAIKVANAGAAAALRREAQALAPLSHPAVPSVHQFGEDEDLEYLVMERISGHTLEWHIERRMTKARAESSESNAELFSLSEVLELLRGLAHGLAAIHACNISHRDIKPSNVMLAPDNRVVLIDFGLFRAEFDTDRERGVSGSPDYMAPEVVTNQLERYAGHSVDIYALGVIGFELLTGYTPYGSSSVSRTLTGHVSSTVPRPDELRAGIPPRLSSLIQAMLAKRWTERPVSAEAVAAELEALRGSIRNGERPTPSVLVVDHDPGTRELLGQVAVRLEPGAHVRAAADADEALELFLAETPDLLLLELELPGMNGVELAMYVRGAYPSSGCEVVFMSDQTRSLPSQLIERLDVTSCLSKGDPIEEALAPIFEGLRRRLA